MAFWSTPSKTSRCAAPSLASRQQHHPAPIPRIIIFPHSSVFSLARSLISLLSTATSRRIQTLQVEREIGAPCTISTEIGANAHRRRGLRHSDSPSASLSPSPGRLLGRIALPFPTALVCGFSASSSLSPLLEIESPVSSRGG